MKKVLFLILILMAILPFANAQYYDPSANFANQWLSNSYVIFGLFFALFFAAIYFALGKTFQGNVAVPAIISAVMAFVIAAGAQQNWLVMQKPVMYWAMFLAAAMLIVILILGFTKFGGLEGGIGIVFGVYGLWPIIKSWLGPAGIYKMPYEVVNWMDKTWWIGLIIAIIMILYAGHSMRQKWRFRYVRP